MCATCADDVEVTEDGKPVLSCCGFPFCSDWCLDRHTQGEEHGEARDD